MAWPRATKNRRRTVSGGGRLWWPGWKLAGRFPLIEINLRGQGYGLKYSSTIGDKWGCPDPTEVARGPA